MSAQDQAKLRWLFLDLNSYFASVEQQERPELRGKPIMVVPVASEHTCAIAASYEAKKFGIRTGTKVREARSLCPGIIAVNARHDLYVEYHHRILEEIERHLHVTKIMSVDEVACALMGVERLTDNAVALARKAQQGILQNVGVCLNSSVGLGPSVLLAKTASDMKKPGGITVIGDHQLPGPLLDLKLRDITGIGRRMETRLQAFGIKSVADLWALTPNRARAVWGSVMGEQVWYGLHGIDPPTVKTERRSIGHSHVLGWRLRNSAAAYLVGRRLLTRAASRLRRAELRAGGLSFFVRVTDSEPREAAARIPVTADTFRLLDMFDELWKSAIRPKENLRIQMIGVNLFGLVPLAAKAPDLFGWTDGQEDDQKHLRLSFALDRLNQRYGSDSIAVGTVPLGLPGYMGGKIAFNRVPDPEDFRG